MHPPLQQHSYLPPLPCFCFVTHHLFTAVETAVFCVSYLVYKKVWERDKKTAQPKELHLSGEREETALQFVLLERQCSELVIAVTSWVCVLFLSDQPQVEGTLHVLHLHILCLYWVTDHTCSPIASPFLPYVTRIYQTKACTFCTQGLVRQGLDASAG